MTDHKIEDFDERNTHRTLSSAYIDEPAIAPLYDDQSEKSILDRLEAETSNRLVGQSGSLDEIDPRELLPDTFGYGWSFVNAAFTYTREGGNRFNREGRGAWYAALAIETCLSEVAFHLSRELENTLETENATKYVQLIAHISGSMASLLGNPGAKCLNPDISIGYPAGQELAANVRNSGLDGIIYPSVRHPGGTCVAAVKPASIKSVTRGSSYLLTWSGGIGPEIAKIS